MLNKISLKSIAEENYPVSNETVRRLMADIDEEVKYLRVEKGKLDNSLLLNPSNQHLKKEMQTL